MVDWINDDGTLVDGFEQNLPEENRAYAKGAKDIASLIGRGANTQREFHTRVKLPTEAKERGKFLDEHFKGDLEARETARKEAADVEAAKAKDAADATAQTEAETQLEAAKARTKEILGEKADVNLELCRRAFRSEHCPDWIKAGVAQVADVEVDKLTDAQALEVIQTDPAVADTLLRFGNLTKDGRMETGDGHRTGGTDEKTPPQPTCPELHKNEPDGSPFKQWFVNRGYDYETATWDGRPL